MSRIACIFVPDFPLAALARLDPGLQDAPCAVVDKHSPLAQLCALSRRARTLGARHGMTVAQAQALVPGLIVLRPPSKTTQADVYGWTWEGSSVYAARKKKPRASSCAASSVSVCGLVWESPPARTSLIWLLDAADCALSRLEWSGNFSIGCR